jgi:hypothetical protein
MKEIPLSQSKVALVDDHWFDYLNQWKWSYFEPRKGDPGYAVRGEGSGKTHKLIYMHRVITNAPAGIEVDHKQGGTLDNQESNLRLCTEARNQWNQRIRSDNTSGYKGVSLDKQNGKWKAIIWKDRHPIFIGRFNTPEEAAHAYDEKASELFGEFAKTNFKEGAE